MKKLMALVLALGMVLAIVGTAGAEPVNSETEWVRVGQAQGSITDEAGLAMCQESDAMYSEVFVRHFRDRYAQQQSWVYCSYGENGTPVT